MKQDSVDLDERLRSELQRDPRVYLAAERTLLAWIRTGIATMGLGFVVARFGVFLQDVAGFERVHVRRSPGLSVWIGMLLVLLGVAANAVAALRHRQFRRRFENGGPYRLERFSGGVLIAFALAAIGLFMIFYLWRLTTQPH